MKIVAVVPMKLNNTRLPQKNTKKFTNGEPLCSYILNTLVTIDVINEVYVYCSNPKIVKYLPDGVKYLQRSEELDRDDANMNDVLLSFSREVKADIYVMTHTTAPFISANSIKMGLKAVVDSKYDSSFAAVKLQDFLWKNYKPFNYSLDMIPRTQDLEPFLMETSGFYIYRKDVIEKYKRRIGEKPYIVEVSQIEAIDIDEPEDFFLADAVFNFMRGN